MQQIFRLWYGREIGQITVSGNSATKSKSHEISNVDNIWIANSYVKTEDFTTKDLYFILNYTKTTD